MKKEKSLHDCADNEVPELYEEYPRDDEKEFYTLMLKMAINHKEEERKNYSLGLQLGLSISAVLIAFIVLIMR